MSRLDPIGSHEASLILGISRAELNRRVRSGRVPTLAKMSGGRTAAWVFDRAAIEALKESEAA